MTYRSTDAEARDTLHYATDADKNVVAIAWAIPILGDWLGPIWGLWQSRGWTVACVPRDQAGPILAAFEAHKKGSAK